MQRLLWVRAISPYHRSGLYHDIALQWGLYVICNPLESFDLRCQSAIYKAEKLPVCLSVSNACNWKTIASVEVGLRLN